MKRVIIEVPDNWGDDPCLLCPAEAAGKCNMTINNCPLANAKEAFEKTSVEMCACVVAKDKGNPVKLYAVEDK